MKKIIIVIALTMILFVPLLQSQSITPQVYSSGGSHLTSGAAQMSYTIGEPLTSSYTSGSVMVTQGFHQPEQSSSGVNEEEIVIFNVYPNPTQNFVTISFTNELIATYTVDLINQLGQTIETKTLSGNNQQLDVSWLTAGSYHLRLTYLQNKTNSFTIIKTTNQ